MYTNKILYNYIFILKNDRNIIIQVSNIIATLIKS